MVILLIKKGENDINGFVSFFDWIKITNATESSEVNFSDGVVGSAVLQGSNLGPGVVGWIVLEHLQTSKTSHHQLQNSTQYLISFLTVTPIPATSDTSTNSPSHPIPSHHLLVQESSFKTFQPSGKNLLCTEQHFHASKCMDNHGGIDGDLVIVSSVILQ